MSEEEKEQEGKRELAEGSYTDFTDWEQIERPRIASLNDFGNNYLSALAINGDDYLRYQAKLNPNQPFNKPG